MNIRSLKKHSHNSVNITNTPKYFTVNNYEKHSNRGCCFPIQAMLSEGFLFHQFNLVSLMAICYKDYFKKRHTSKRKS